VFASLLDGRAGVGAAALRRPAAAGSFQERVLGTDVAFAANVRSIEETADIVDIEVAATSRPARATNTAGDVRKGNRGVDVIVLENAPATRERSAFSAPKQPAADSGDVSRGAELRAPRVGWGRSGGPGRREWSAGANIRRFAGIHRNVTIAPLQLRAAEGRL
jgi:hypothetical protein